MKMYTSDLKKLSEKIKTTELDEIPISLLKLFSNVERIANLIDGGQLGTILV